MSAALIHYQDGFEHRPGRLESATFAFVAACFSPACRRCEDDYSHRAQHGAARVGAARGKQLMTEFPPATGGGGAQIG